MKKENEMTNGFTCTLPYNEYSSVLLAHGGGGKLSHQLFQNIILPCFRNEKLEQQHDGAVFSIGNVRLAYTTDSYVIQPLFFPGGNIGTLAINGTVNDLAMCGAVPKYLSVAFIIEEGLPMNDLWRIVNAMKDAATAADVELVTGDTKVVNHGKGDKIFINTSGIGIVPEDISVHPKRVCAGDKIILSGRIGEHGIAVMSLREGLEFETEIQSDCAPLSSLVQSILAATRNVHMMRDPTRGGIASALNEIAEAANVGININESAIPIRDDVRSACEILGLDPLYVANEGKMIAFVPPSDAEKTLSTIQAHPLGTNASIIGEVVTEHPRMVIMKTSIGSSRVVDMISGEQLPRIC
jgi:hydrogenase expression/formation protein HypE